MFWLNLPFEKNTIHLFLYSFFYFNMKYNSTTESRKISWRTKFWNYHWFYKTSQESLQCIHTGSQMFKSVCTLHLSTVRLCHVFWLLPKLRVAFSSSLIQVCDLSLWHVVKQPSLDRQALPSASPFPEEQLNTEVKWPTQAPSPFWIWIYAFTLSRKALT